MQTGQGPPHADSTVIATCRQCGDRCLQPHRYRYIETSLGPLHADLASTENKKSTTEKSIFSQFSSAH